MESYLDMVKGIQLIRYTEDNQLQTDAWFTGHGSSSANTNNS